MLSQKGLYGSEKRGYLHASIRSSYSDNLELAGNTDHLIHSPCWKCTGAAPADILLSSNAINELCRILCTDECRQSLSSLDSEPLLEVPFCSKTERPVSTVFQQFSMPLTYDIRANQEFVSKNSLTKEIDLKRPQFFNGILRRSDSYEDCRSRSNNVENRFKSSNVICHTFDDDTNSIESNNIEMLTDMNRKLELAEALARISEMTSTPQIKQRLAARKIEIELENTTGTRHSKIADNSTSENKRDYEPPRDLLLYLVRMGSFNSAPKIQNIDSQDDGLEFPKGLNNNELLQHVKQLRGNNQPSLLSRYFLKPFEDHTVSHEITEGLRSLKLGSDSKGDFVCNASLTTPNHIRLLQWNILSQSLGQNNDGFVRCPDGALTWENRKFLIVQEILQTNPDLICLQEVDHFKFLQNILGTQNYDGIFFPKPDSPCLYFEQNNGPDGCAIFYKRDMFEMINFDTRVLEVWRVQSNQVAIAANLRIKASGKEICACTTHLKARHGALLSKLRNEQGRDLIRFLKKFSNGRPILLCGDFNAEPVEPVYSTILTSDILNLSSAYSDINQGLEKCNGSSEELEEISDKVTASIQREPTYTTWKIREDGEVCHTIDYIFYTNEYLKVKNCLEFPQGDDIGMNRTPSFQYPSDHFSLVCDFEFIQ